MRTYKLALFLFVVSLSAVAESFETLAPKINIKLDPSFGAARIKAIRADFKTLADLKIEAPKGSSFSGSFNGTNSQAILNYLAERIHFLFPSDSTNPSDSNESANNVGTAFWIQSIGLNQPISLQIGSEAVPLISSRVGLIELGNLYSDKPDNAMPRMSDLVHEARHSDCTGGLKRSDAVAFANKRYSEMSSHLCGHLHSICPPGHELAGLYACDDHPWGAYSIEFVFNEALMHKCKNCNEMTKQIAFISLNDAVSRFQFDMIKLLNTPDMSDDPTVRD